MGFERKLRLEDAVLVFSAAIVCMQLHHSVDGTQQLVPCFFIFGDSLSDCGNNNNLKTDAKVNFMPYGVDFPTGASGRFSNGLIPVDFLAQMMGFPNFIPPFASAGGSDLLKGVNYASGAAGIRPETGTHMGENFCFEHQIANHKSVVSEISKRVGGAENAKSHLNKCLYYVNIGSNDYINNYFAPEHYQTGKNYTPHQYAEVLIQQYSQQIKTLHQLGARKFALSGVGVVGCTPQIVKKLGNSSSLCVDEVNNAVMPFNQKLKQLVDQLKGELFEAKLIFINSAGIPIPKLSGTKKGRKFGVAQKMKEWHDEAVRNAFEPCCKTKAADGICAPNITPCRYRDLHIFWDGFHPTEMLTRFIAKSIFRAPSPTFCYPMDISHLIRS